MIAGFKFEFIFKDFFSLELESVDFFTKLIVFLFDYVVFLCQGGHALYFFLQFFVLLFKIDVFFFKFFFIGVVE